MTTDCLPLNPDEYVKNPNFCPECGSEEINAGHSTFENTEAWQAVDCSVCGAEWHDLFTLTGYELVTDDKVYTQAEVDDIIGPESWPKAIIRSMTSDEPIRSEDALGEHIWTDLYGYLPVKEFTGAVRVQPQPELHEFADDMVTVLMADGRTLAVQSVDLYYED